VSDNYRLDLPGCLGQKPELCVAESALKEARRPRAEVFLHRPLTGTDDEAIPTNTATLGCRIYASE
jgi:hypothetical protein